MRRLTLVLALICVLVPGIFQTGRAEAHVLKQDNGLYVVMHIDPDDNPAAKESTTILLDFGSTNGGFKLSDCNCNLALSQSNHAVAISPLVPAFFGASSQAITRTTFPQTDVYQLIVSGTSKSHKFNNFSVSFLIRVDHSSTKTANDQAFNGSTVILLSAASLALLAIAGWYGITTGKRYKVLPTPKKQRPKKP